MHLEQEAIHGFKLIVLLFTTVVSLTLPLGLTSHLS